MTRPRHQGFRPAPAPGLGTQVVRVVGGLLRHSRPGSQSDPPNSLSPVGQGTKPAC